MSWRTLIAMCALLASQAAAQQPLKPVVEAEEMIYEFTNPNNGSGPLWCFGCTCIVRHGEDVFASGQETLKDFQPLNNTRWMFFKRTANGWELQQADPKDRQREPCPLGIFSDGRIFLSTNPTLTKPEARNGPANPHLLQFSVADPKAPPVALQPVWVKNPGFSEHSYRGMGVDGVNHEIVMLNAFGYEDQYWAFLDRDGKWANKGIIKYPVRACYEEVALVNRACHVLGVGDITEPNKEWREWKLAKSDSYKRWDYVFRRMFYAWTPDISTTQFSEPLEVDSVEKTAGYMFCSDVWVDKTGAAHLLYRKQTVQVPAMRDKFFPGVPIRTSLEHCVVKDNKVVSRDTLVIGGEGVGKEIPDYGRLHATEDGRLFAFYHLSGAANENRLMEILPDGKHADPVKVELKHPFTSFMTATERGGSPPSRILDVLGTCSGDKTPAIHYARIRLQ